MFYQECVLLAREYPELRDLINKIDILLYKQGVNGLFKPTIISRSIQESLSQVEGVCESLTEKGLLIETVYHECPHCENLFLREDFDSALEQYDEYECSQCSSNLGKTITEAIKMYSLNPDKMIRQKLSKMTPRPLKVFYSYAHEDETLRRQLENHLAPMKRLGWIVDWYDRKIIPGSDIEKEIDVHLKEAHLILLLVSSDFFASDYCYGVEMKYAMEKHELNEMRVVPVILRDCDWSIAPFANLKALPEDGRAVLSKSWNTSDEAFTDVAKGIRTIAAPE